MTPQETLDLFKELRDELVAELANLEDWGWSGGRSDQYTHDVVADELIVPRLTEAGFCALTEESGMTGYGRVTVVVDPVDGSTNASRALPWYAISLCAVDDDGPLVGLVANLETGQTFTAVRGEGAHMDDQPIRPNACTDIGSAIVAFSGWPPTNGGWAQYRSMGAGALDLCGVACGMFDGFLDVNSAHGVWDYIAAMLICSEAGALIVDSRGRNLVTLDPAERRAPLAAATPELMGQLQSLATRWAMMEE